MERSKIGVFFLVVIVGLAGIGASYAAWNEENEINVSGEYGEINVRFTSAGLTYHDGDYDGISASLDAEKKTLSVELTNLYPKPDYDTTKHDETDYVYLEIEVLNDGEIPVEIESVVASAGTGEWNHLRFYRGTQSGMTLSELVNHMETGFATDPKMEPGESHSTGVYIWLDEDSPYVDGGTASFTLTFNYKQADPATP